MFQSWSNL